MFARDLANRYGDRLIGQRIQTEPIGEWPGGPARVLAVGHIDGDENIVLQVRDDRGEEIGVFHDENVELLLPEKE